MTASLATRRDGGRTTAAKAARPGILRVFHSSFRLPASAKPLPLDHRPRRGVGTSTACFLSMTGERKSIRSAEREGRITKPPAWKALAEFQKTSIATGKVASGDMFGTREFDHGASQVTVHRLTVHAIVVAIVPGHLRVGR